MPAGDPAVRPAPGAPIVVAGMHRSGTSLVASWIAAAGIGVGERLLPADAANPRGYFEDLDVVELNGRTLRAAVPADEPGHPDWGWTESERWDPAALAAHLPAARALAARRQARGIPWGFKDPRTAVLLDSWDEALTGSGTWLGARYFLVYRFPWEVADSMQRLGAAVFLDHPEYAYRIWAFYNRRLLDFRRRHRDRTLLVSADALVRAPGRLSPLLAERFGLDLPASAAEPLVDRGLFATFAADDPLPALVAAASPEVVELLAELDREADLPATGLWSTTSRRARPIPPPDDLPLSIVIPCYDMGELLLEAVASVERNVPEPYELIVVDDGSRQERTEAVLASLRRAGYTVLHEENAGLAAARNLGVAAARGRHVLPLDADNRLLPGFAAAALRVLDADSAVGVVYGGRVEFGARTQQVEVPEFDLDSLLRANFIDACAVFRREVWEQCGGYDAAMPAMGWEDWDLWIGAAERGWAFRRLPAMTFEYRVRPGSMASRLHTAEVGVPLRLYMIDKHRELYRQRLPQLLTAQHRTAEAETELARVAATHDRLVAELSGARQPLETELASVEAERDRLYGELDSWRRRVAFMEGTRAWRLRRWILKLRGR